MMNPGIDPLRQLNSLSPVAAILVGVLLLFLGRKLFWLFVAAVGFIVGSELAAVAFPHEPGWTLLAGVVLGLIGAVLALFLQKIAVGAAGFLAGGYFLMALSRAWELHAPGNSWISFLVGGFVGAILMALVFDWALIIFSSISGAHLITHALGLAPGPASVVFVVLLVIGIVTQFNRLLTRPGPAI